MDNLIFPKLPEYYLMTKFLAFIFIAVCFLGASAQAQDIGNFAARLPAASKNELSASVDELVKKGVISPDQAAQAREQLKQMNQKDLQKLHEQAQSLFQ